jgi:hypothetical protein
MANPIINRIDALTIAVKNLEQAKLNSWAKEDIKVFAYEIADFKRRRFQNLDDDVLRARDNFDDADARLSTSTEYVLMSRNDTTADPGTIAILEQQWEVAHNDYHASEYMWNALEDNLDGVHASWRQAKDEAEIAEEFSIAADSVLFAAIDTYRGACRLGRGYDTLKQKMEIVMVAELRAGANLGALNQNIFAFFYPGINVKRTGPSVGVVPRLY